MIPLPKDEPQQPLQPLQRDIKLHPFWTSRPRAWFTYIEWRFCLRRITDDQQMFNHVMSALPAEMVSQLIDVLDTLPEKGQYEYFKNQLLNIYQLSNYEKFDMLVKMEPMGGWKPSQLLHAMLEFCPLGMERHLSLHYFFMQHLPQALRTQLGEVQPGDPRALTVRADRWTGGDFFRQHRRGERLRQRTRRAGPRTRRFERRSQGAGGHRRPLRSARRRADTVRLGSRRFFH